MKKIIDNYPLLIIILCFTCTINCNGQKVESFEVPLEGVFVYVEGLQGEGWLTANPFGELVMLDSRSQTRHVLTWDDYYYAHPNLTPDGKSLIFESKRGENIGIAGLSADSDIYRMDLETKDITNLNEEISLLIGESLGHRISQPSLSPSGTKLAMVRLVDWQFHLSYYDFNRNKIIDITTDDSFKPLHGIEWSPDNQKIIYSRRRGFRTSVVLNELSEDDINVIPLENYNEDGEPYGCSAGSWIDNYRFIYSCSRPNSSYIKIYEYDMRISTSRNIKTLFKDSFEFVLSKLKITKNEDIVLFIGTIPGSQFNNIYSLDLDTNNLLSITSSESIKDWLQYYEE